MRKIRWYIATIQTILCVGCAVSQNKFISVETVQGIKDVCVPVLCGAPTPDNIFKITKMVGSGFFINSEGYFLTAGHVIDDWEKIDKSKGDCFPAVYFPVRGWDSGLTILTRWFPFADCVRPNDLDVAVCKTVDNPFIDPKTITRIKVATFDNSPSIADGTPVAFTGFPLNFQHPVTSIGHIASFIEIANLLIIDKAAWPGGSGSPVYLANGKVVGVLTKWGINEGIGLSYAIKAKSILEFLSKNKIAFQSDKSQQDKK